MWIGWEEAKLVFWIYIPGLIWLDTSPAITSCKCVQTGPNDGNNLSGQRPCDQSSKHDRINKVPTSQYLPRGVPPLCWSPVISQTPPNSFPTAAFVIQPHIYSDRIWWCQHVVHWWWGRDLNPWLPEPQSKLGIRQTNSGTTKPVHPHCIYLAYLVNYFGWL